MRVTGNNIAKQTTDAATSDNMVSISLAGESVAQPFQ